MKRNIILIYLFSALFYFYIDLALWPIFLTDKKGFSIVDLGIFQVALTLARFIFEIPSGILCDKFGRVKTLAASTLACIFSNIFILFGESRLSIIIGYVFFGLSMAFISGTIEAFLYDSLKADNKQHKYKLINTNHYLITMISFSIAMALGGYISDYNMNYMYVGNIIALILALVTCLFMIEPPISSSEVNTIKKIISDSIVTMKTNRILLYLISFITITAAISNTTWHLSQKLLSQYGMSNMNISYEAIFTTLAAGLAAKAGYYIEKKLNKVGFSIFTSVILVFPLIVLGITNNIYLLMFTLTLTTISVSFAEPIYSEYINAEVESSFRATLLSIQNLIASIFSLAFVFILGLTNSIGLAFVVVGIISIPVYLIILRKIQVNNST